MAYGYLVMAGVIAAISITIVGCFLMGVIAFLRPDDGDG